MVDFRRIRYLLPFQGKVNNSMKTPDNFGNPLVFLHTGQALSAGSDGNFGGKTERISDCWANSFFEKNMPVNYTKFGQFVSLQTQDCIKSLGVSDQRSKYSNTLGKFQIIRIIFFEIDGWVSSLLNNYAHDRESRFYSMLKLRIRLLQNQNII